MAAANSQRLLNLLIALLTTRRFISRERIRELVQGYADAPSDAAFQRMFERDKEDLRALGVEVEVGPTDRYTDELDGYRVRPDTFYLPDITLTREESTLVGLALSVWNEPGMAASVEQAVTKLRAAGQPVAGEQLGFLYPRLSAREPAFATCWGCLLDRVPVRFTYHGRAREVRAWKLIQRSGTWYLLGESVGDGPRLFRLSRIEDTPQPAGAPGSYALPDPAEIALHAARLEPPAPSAGVVVAIRESAAGELRRRGQVVDVQAPEGYQAVAVPYAREDEIVSAIAAYGPDVLVLDEGDIRTQVIARLRAVAGVKP